MSTKNGIQHFFQQVITLETVLVYILFGTALFLLFDGFYIKAKAKYAQYLIASSWHHYAQTGEQQKPWPWADTYPIGELTIQNESHYILSGASGRNLAFGPTHLLNTSELGAPGNAAIAGHRDTHFDTLKKAELGDLVYLTSRQQEHIVKQVYRVTDIRIVDQYDLDVLAPTPQSSITLITCYPFDSIEPNPTQRYVVHAQKI